MLTRVTGRPRFSPALLALSLLVGCSRGDHAPHVPPTPPPTAPAPSTQVRGWVWTLAHGELDGLRRLGAQAAASWVVGRWGDSPKCTASYPCYTCSATRRAEFFADGRAELWELPGGGRCARIRKNPDGTVLRWVAPPTTKPAKPAAQPTAKPIAAAAGPARRRGTYRVLDARRVELRFPSASPMGR